MQQRRNELATTLLGSEFQDLEHDEQAVLSGIAAGVPIAQDASDLDDANADLADRLADRVAAIGGSWSFIIGFALVLFGWMLLNSEVLAHFGMAFDPYPYIFLNLMLSTLAAIQAPVIMMSQNRQAAKDRMAAKLDYQVNLRAELEILRIHAKIDEEIIARLDRLSERLDRTG
ncbi:DUF1003 domain-containing protein [Sphingomonas sanxanigenens]|uniref:Cyclic nucleotide-binding protein n=1 Tax=Sphingomonas sanxanigenens DSM 19645 = NX02 TaxID=1123269 RepID=W0AAL8_9SPHN|nr:DUF1003 domain-containing protein [Sphingomonas sanxanigenens]AHE53507.1 hypothetical protein NX02_08920 [Sphingomonas sanxanigenens DSM 19645 = NX02]